MTDSLRRFLASGLILLAATLSACGSGGDSLNTQNNTPTVAPPTPFVPGTGFLEIDQPAINIMLQANSATLSLTQDGTSTVLVMTTPPTPTNTVGFYVGSGYGNKGILQLDGFDSVKMSELGGVELDAKLGAGTNDNFYMNFIVDLDCIKNEDVTILTIAQMRANRRIIVWNPAPGVVQPDGYTRYSTSASAADWRIVGTPLLGFGANPSGTPAALTPTFSIAGYPNACIVDGISADGGLPRNRNIPACATNAALNPATDLAQCGIAHKGALVLLGDSITLSNKVWNVKRVKIKDRVIVFR
jgi:hypothetical protein